MTPTATNPFSSPPPSVSPRFDPAYSPPALSPCLPAGDQYFQNPCQPPLFPAPQFLPFTATSRYSIYLASIGPTFS